MRINQQNALLYCKLYAKCLCVVYVYKTVSIIIHVCTYVWQSQVESEHYSYQILTAFSDSALYNSRLKEAMALQFVVEIVLPF